MIPGECLYLPKYSDSKCKLIIKDHVQLINCTLVTLSVAKFSLDLSSYMKSLLSKKITIYWIKCCYPRSRE
ncbi:hypothetical protein KP509_13G026200 [Ceratopteris richardii]|uniref:Uncharacterized protein n=1 Tax=Ceratopteris richardii TaxID=49495 RepID=A0A8T2TE83_CERRI|nr:hypothetical protein KP509_13G026200 [Ceratopteris richardii]